jgi:hypothetical protein
MAGRSVKPRVTSIIALLGFFALFGLLFLVPDDWHPPDLVLLRIEHK